MRAAAKLILALAVGTVNCFTIDITPRINVVPSVKTDQDQFVVEYGNSMEVLCSSSAGAWLSTANDSDLLLPTVAVDNYTVSHLVKDPDLQVTDYICHANSTSPLSPETRATIKVVPKIYFQVQNITLTATQVKQLDYREPIEIYCSGPRAVKLLDINKNTNAIDDKYVPMPKQLIENTNQTTVKIIKKFEIGTWHVGCSDSESFDNGYFEHINEIDFTVLPRIEVQSPHVRHIGTHKYNGGQALVYSIKHGDPYQIVCSGAPDVEYRESGYPAEVERVNQTTIKAVAGIGGIRGLTCFRPSCGSSCEVSAVVGVMPADADAVDFVYVTQQQHVNCSWTAASPEVNYTLFHNNNDTLIPVCDLPSISPQDHRIDMFFESPKASYDDYKIESTLRHCLWDIKNENKQKDIRVLMKMCNKFGCSNKTFHIDRSAYEKLDPPAELQLLNTTSRGAVLRWNTTTLPWEDSATAAEDLIYKAQYRYSGINTQYTDPTSLKCHHSYCEIELKLPCPNEKYEVQIYQKLEKAMSSECWSEPSSVTVLLDVKNIGNYDVHPECLIETPSIEVKSPNLRFVGSQKGVDEFAIKYEEELVIICSGNVLQFSTGLLDLYSTNQSLTNHINASILNINETAKRYLVFDKPGMNESIKYVCKARSQFAEKEAQVIVSSLPADDSDFRCVSHHLQFLRCTWTAPRDTANFSLSAGHGARARVCEPPSSQRKVSCDWYSRDIRDTRVLSMAVERCNDVACSRQTFDIDQLSVLKLAAPLALIALNTTSNSTELRWNSTNIYFAGGYLRSCTGDIIYRVQYHNGISYADSSLVSHVTCDVEYCKAKLTFPYFGSNMYQVQVYQKQSRALGAGLWSDAASVSVYTSTTPVQQPMKTQNETTSLLRIAAISLVISVSVTAIVHITRKYLTK